VCFIDAVAGFALTGDALLGEACVLVEDFMVAW
jgi:hypothetical protein